jgi:hypothetical protein
MEDKNMKYTFEKWLVTPRKNEEGEISGYALFNSIDNPDIHFPMEVFVSESDMKENEVYDLDVLFYCHGINKIARNKEEFLGLDEPLSFEATIPTGSFPLDENDKDFKPEPVSLINCTITHIVTNEEVPHPDNILIFDASLLGLEIEAAIVAEKKCELPKLTKGNILSGIFWAEAELF